MQIIRDQSKLKSLDVRILPKMRTYIGTGKFVPQRGNDSQPCDVLQHSPMQNANRGIRSALSDIRSKYDKGVITLQEKKAAESVVNASAQAQVNNSQLVTPLTAPEI